jgi:hypothetical protein
MTILTKDDLLDALMKECDVCIHLHGKIPDGGLEYRPSEAQWSTLELLRYISFCGIGFARAMIESDWDPYEKMEEEASVLDPEDFPAAMESQKRRIQDLLGALTDREIAEREALLPWGETMSLGRALLSLPLRCLSGYRMQLFLYAKAAGNADLVTRNCWHGVDVES